MSANPQRPGTWCRCKECVAGRANAAKRLQQGKEDQETKEFQEAMMHCLRYVQPSTEFDN
jgi:hypothetical protein